MVNNDKLNLKNPNFLDFIVDRRVPLVCLIFAVSLFFIWIVPNLLTDPTLKSGVDPTSSSYKEYQKFLEEFGDEEFILVSIHKADGINNSAALKGLAEITGKIEQMDIVTETISLSNLKLFQKKGENYGNFPVVQEAPAGLYLPEVSQLSAMKQALPIMELLVSNDFTTLGILVRFGENYKFDTAAVRKFSDDIKTRIAELYPTGTDVRVVGSAMIRQAIVRYNLQTGIIFGSLCMLIGTIVSVYVFKSFKITLITNFILSLCVLWVLGLMSLFKVPLNSTTALSFGFIPITTLEIVIHMVVRSHQYFKETRDKMSAIKMAVRWLARPCLICSATTAVGFGSLMVSSIPMVNQLGFIMSFGIILSYCLAMVLTPAFFSYMKFLDHVSNDKVVVSWMDGVLKRTSDAIFNYPKYIVGIGFVITVFLFAGTPFIKSDSQILRMLSERTPEVQDIAFVEKHLTDVNGLELILEAEPNSFRSAEQWKNVSELDKKLRAIPEVVAVDSFLPLLQYIDKVSGNQDRTDYFSDPSLLPQLLMVTSLSPEGERIVSRHLNADYSILHIPIRIKNNPDVPISKTIANIREVAERTVTFAKPVLTGELTIVSDQTAELIDDQIKSMILAAILITLLMMLQMESVTLGLICLIPNIPAVAAVFGIMGWFGISLDSITVFAATVAIGLAVDNTIHYLTQLRRDMSMFPGRPIEEYVGNAYNLTARQIASWSVVTLFGFLALAVSPFRPVVFFGILGCSSILLGLFGDLVFLQSLIMVSPRIRNTILRLVAKQTSGSAKNKHLPRPAA